MDYKDYYEILGLKKGASAKEIRSAYRKLARRHHPDVNPGNSEAEERFKEINEANEVLSDPEKRRLYDELGPRWREYEGYRAAGGTATPEEFTRGTNAGRSQGSAPRYSTSSTMSEDDLQDLFGDASPYSDFFQDLFGREARSGGQARRGAATPLAGQDIEQEVEITLEEAVNGTTRVLTFRDQDGQHRIEARIPAGSREGSRIRLAGQGGPGYNGGKNGDLYLVIHVQPDPVFTVTGADLQVQVQVPLFTCLLGGEVLAPTPKGRRLALTIPPETQNGRVFRLTGQGLPPLRTGEKAGDLYVTVQVTLPTHLSEEERSLVARLAELHGAREGASV